MANFDEDIKRITDEILSDGTVDYGKLEKAVKERVEQVLVPFIDTYDMSAYIVKLDTVLTEIKLTELFEEYKKFVARNMDTSGREVELEESPEYEAITVYFEFEDYVCSDTKPEPTYEQL